MPVHVERSLKALLQLVLSADRQLIIAFDTLHMLQGIQDALEDQPAIAAFDPLRVSSAAVQRAITHLRLWKLQAVVQLQRALNSAVPHWSAVMAETSMGMHSRSSVVSVLGGLTLPLYSACT